MRLLPTLPTLSLAAPLLALTACVTINVYFPAAAAEKAADRVIDEVWGRGNAGPGAAPATPPASEAPRTAPPVSQSAPGTRFTLDGVLIAALELLVPAAHAQDANLDISSAEIKQLQGAMSARHAELLPHYVTGAVGVATDGGIAVRDLNLVPLPQRNTVKKLVADENGDRSALYREIARANNHPEWEAQIRSTFATRWAARAQGGWYVQSGGGWMQK